MKKSVSIVLCLITSVILIMLLPSCHNGGTSDNSTSSPEEQEHIHSYVSSIVEPTCASRGYTVYTCGCGYSYMDGYVDATGHIPGGEWLTDKEPTCQSTGSMFRRCSVCEAVAEVSDIDMVSHNYSKVITPPTESDEGYTVYTCSMCEGSYTDAYVTALGYSSGLSFSPVMGGYSLSGIGECTDSDIIIPMYYRGKKVIAIADSAFFGQGITSVIIPDTVTSIGRSAFERCVDIVSVDMSDSVKTVGDRVFCGCEKLERVNLSAALELISSEAFLGCVSMESIYIPESVASIGSYAFRDCSVLDGVSFPYGLKYIGKGTFRDCSSLSQVDIGDIEDIVSEMFFGCISLENIIIPQTVLSVGSEAFRDCKRLVSVALPDGVTVIRDSAFRGCEALSSVDMGNVGLIGYNAFSDCVSLVHITIPNSVTVIESYAFYRCSSLVSVTVGASVTSLGYHTFDGCDRIVEIYNLSSLKITAGASDDYSGLSGNALDVYKSLEYASKLRQDDNGFIFRENGSDCSLVEYIGNSASIVLPQNIGGKCYKINAAAFCGNTDITSVIISDGVSAIGEKSFSGCVSLSSVSVGASVLEIEREAFSGCAALSSVTLMDGVKRIAEYSFSGCTSLKEISIPDSVSWIEANAFYRCSALACITVSGNNSAYSSYEGNLYNRGMSVLYCYAIGKSDSFFALPSSVTEIAGYAFCGAVNLTDILLPSDIGKICDNVFGGCEAFSAVWYEGTSSSWARLSIGNNSVLKSISVYFYFETKPSDEGEFWHYDADGNAVLW